MATTIKRLSIGVVGEKPGFVLLSTDDGLAEITSPGYINDVQEESEVEVNPQDFIFTVYENDTLGLFAPAFNNGIITLTPPSGTGDITGAANLPGGDGLFASEVAGILNFKSLVAGLNTSFDVLDDTITINSTGGVTDGNNLGAGEGLFAQKTGSILDFKSLIAGTGMSFVVDGTSVTLNSTAGLPALNNFQYVSNTGNDANSGTSLDQAKATFGAAITALGSPIFPNVGVVICLDTGPYAENITITQDNILIYAPMAFITPATGTALSYKAPGAALLGGEFGALIAGVGGTGITFTNLNGFNIRAGIVVGNIDMTAVSVSGVIMFIDTMQGDLIAPTSSVNGEIFSLAGNITPTNSFNGRVGLNWHGSFSTLGPSRISFASLASIGDGQTLSALHQGRLLQANSGAPITVTCPEDATLNLDAGWQTECIRQGAGTVTFTTEGADTFVGGGTTRSITAQGDIVKVVKIASGLWAVS